MDLIRKEHARHSKRVTSTRRWQVLRQEILERDDWKCRRCGERQRLEVDHIKPVRTHPELSFDPVNLQVLCGGCHSSKTRIECGHPPQRTDRQDWAAAVNALMSAARQPRRLFSLPPDLRPSAVPVTIVCGPPGAGKSTWVRSVAQSGDTVIDFDNYVKTAGGKKWSQDREVVRNAFKMRNAALRGLSNQTRGRAYFIVTAPSEAERSAWRRVLVRAQINLMATPAAECRRRIAADPDRDHARERMFAAVEDWWRVFDNDPVSPNHERK